MQHEEQQSLSSTTATSWDGSDESRTASTASLVRHKLRSTPIKSASRVGPGLLLFPGTAQRTDPSQPVKDDKLQKSTANTKEDHVGLNHRKPCSIRSFRRPPLWQPPAINTEQEALEEQQLQLSPLPYMAKLHAFIIEFLQGSSIHGFIYLAKFGLNFLER